MTDLKKLADQLGKLTVLEAAELTKLLEEEWGVSAAAPMAVAMHATGAPAEAEPVEEKTEFLVTLKELGPKKIDVIKAIRQITNLGLADAKALAETAGAKVLEGASKEAAQDAKSKLEAAGATVELS
jgi:large subunit ribosomal protein L7/L12